MWGIYPSHVFLNELDFECLPVSSFLFVHCDRQNLGPKHFFNALGPLNISFDGVLYHVVLVGVTMNYIYHSTECFWNHLLCRFIITIVVYLIFSCLLNSFHKLGQMALHYQTLQKLFEGFAFLCFVPVIPVV
ncbi:hypothetical protein LguiB_009416 [Lonicera macranthoides]